MPYIWIWRPTPSLPEIGVQSVESGVLEERHHARVELLDDVVEVHFGGLLVDAERLAPWKSALANLPRISNLPMPTGFGKR